MRRVTRYCSAESRDRHSWSLLAILSTAFTLPSPDQGTSIMARNRWVCCDLRRRRARCRPGAGSRRQGGLLQARGLIVPAVAAAVS